MKKILEKMNIKINVINYDTTIDENYNIAFAGIINLLDKQNKFCDYFPELYERTLYKVSDILGCHYIFIKTPFMNEDKIVIIGPFLLQDITHAKILEKAEKMNLNPQTLSQLEYYYSSTHVDNAVYNFRENMEASGTGGTIDFAKNSEALYII